MLGLVAGTALVWDKMMSIQNKISSANKLSISFEPNKEVSFRDDFIVVNKGGETKVFSSRCTHLGCKINKYADDKLICPCHGSTFDLNGSATKGPAFKSLKEINFEIDEISNTINIIT